MYMRFLAPRHCLFPRFLVPDTLFLRFWGTFISALFGTCNIHSLSLWRQFWFLSAILDTFLHFFPYFYAAVISISAGAYPGFCTMKRLGIFLLPPGWDASSSQGYPIKFAGAHLCTCDDLAQVRNARAPVRAQTRTARSVVERTNSEATTPLHSSFWRRSHFISGPFDTGKIYFRVFWHLWYAGYQL